MKATASPVQKASLIDPPTSHNDSNGDSWNEQDRIWIPSDHANRTLILCFDGTGDQFDEDNSNVVQLVSMLRKDDTSKQLVYYQAGIGTYTDTAIKTPVLAGLSKALDEAFAWNIHSHIKAGYSFLMQNYTFGDKICIFGFSRGAYTARALAGMLQKVGLLPPYNDQQIYFAYDMYRREAHGGPDLSGTFKRTFCREVSVDFLGVWDTVASVGFFPHYLPFISENKGIKYLRHALALDERRIKFLPSYCVGPARSLQPKEKESEKREMVRQESEGTLNQDTVNEKTADPPGVFEVWFAGVHTDVGGGSVKNETDHALARIPLRWMIRECFKCEIGIIFDAVMLQHIGLNIYPENGVAVLGDQPKRLTNPPALERRLPKKTRSSLLSFFGPSDPQPATDPTTARLPSSPNALKFHSPEEGAQHEASAEFKDATSPLNDQLAEKWIWNILEWIPVRVKKQKAIVKNLEGPGAYKWVWNKGQGRKIFKDEMKEGMCVHHSVKTRLEAGAASEGRKPGYVPKVRPHLRSPKTSDANGKGKGRSKSKQPVSLRHEEWNLEEPVHWEWVH